MADRRPRRGGPRWPRRARRDPGPEGRRRRGPRGQRPGPLLGQHGEQRRRHRASTPVRRPPTGSPPSPTGPPRSPTPSARPSPPVAAPRCVAPSRSPAARATRTPPRLPSPPARSSATSPPTSCRSRTSTSSRSPTPSRRSRASRSRTTSAWSSATRRPTRTGRTWSAPRRPAGRAGQGGRGRRQLIPHHPLRRARIPLGVRALRASCPCPSRPRRTGRGHGSVSASTAPASFGRIGGRRGRVSGMSITPDALEPEFTLTTAATRLDFLSRRDNAATAEHRPGRRRGRLGLFRAAETSLTSRGARSCSPSARWWPARPTTAGWSASARRSGVGRAGRQIAAALDRVPPARPGTPSTTRSTRQPDRRRREPPPANWPGPARADAAAGGSIRAGDVRQPRRVPS